MKEARTALKEQYKDSSNFRKRAALAGKFGANKYGWYRWVFDQFGLNGHRTVLELGCGPGILWKHNLDRVPEGTVVLSDFSAGMLRDCARNLGGHAARFRFCQLDGTALPFRDRSVDTVVANMMFYHVENRAAALRDIRRVLSQGGAFYATTTGHAYMRELLAETNRILGVSPRAASAERFGLETGYQQLAGVFAQVETIRYENSLRVTETQPLMDYFLSMTPFITAPPERWTALREHFDGIIRERGGIDIPVAMGMLIGRD